MPTDLSQEVLALLRCPETRQPLREATAEELARFATDLPEGAFIVEDGSRLYPVRDGFPVLIAAESVRGTTGGQQD
ncbi:MAG: Trm112 family protein [Verrucomicrobiales bacterium]